MALRRMGDRAPVVLFPQGNTSWWHDREDGPWGTYVLMEAIPAALARSGADHDRVAIGGISMGGSGALDLGRLARRPSAPSEATHRQDRRRRQAAANASAASTVTASRCLDAMCFAM
jgi:S-formylglutathione hydrolase FrmB